MAEAPAHPDTVQFLKHLDNARRQKDAERNQKEAERRREEEERTRECE